MKVVDAVLSCVGLWMKPLLSLIHQYAWDSHMDFRNRTEFHRNCLQDLKILSPLWYSPSSLNESKQLLGLVLLIQRRQSLFFYGSSSYSPNFKNDIICWLELSHSDDVWSLFYTNERKKIMIYYFTINLNFIRTWIATTPDWQDWQMICFLNNAVPDHTLPPKLNKKVRWFRMSSP